MDTTQLSIVFEDEAILLINKPAGITVNKSETTIHEKTVQDLVEEYIGIKPLPESKTHGRVQEAQAGEEDGVETFDASKAFYFRAGIVHRIDKETSGLLLIAKNLETFLDLQKQFKEREVHKVYRALVHGRVVPTTGEINVPVGRLPWNRRQFGVVAGGRESVTKYQVLGYFRTDDKRREIVSLLELKPLTGRTHQIRVHLQYLGHPIFSDFLYAGRKTQKVDRRLLGRVFLHAATLSFRHPISRKEVTFDSPLPEELAHVMDQLVPVV